MLAIDKRKVLRSVFIFLTFIGLGAVVIWVTPTDSVAGAREPDQSEIMEGITLGDSLSSADRLYLQHGMQFLHEYLPEWSEYLAQAKPLIFALEPGGLGTEIEAGSQCCDENGNGLILFNDHFGSRAMSSDSADQTPEARQIEFLSTLMHEATHVRQRREGTVPGLLTPEDCVAAEHAAYSIEVEFAHALLVIKLDADSISAANFRRYAPRHLNAAFEKLQGTSWKFHCVVAHSYQEQPEQ